MDKVQAKIEELLKRSRSEEISITQIRKELTESAQFSDDEVSMICREFSDREMSKLHAPQKSVLSYFENVYLAYILTAVFLALVIFAAYKIYELNGLKELGDVPNSMVLWRYFLLAGAVLFLVRNFYRVIQHLKSKK